MIGKLQCTFAQVLLALIIASSAAFAQKTIHVFSPWVADASRAGYSMLIQGQSNGGFGSWWPGTPMTDEGGGWYSFTFPAGSGANDIQFRIMNAISENGNWAQQSFAGPTGLTATQGSSISNVALFATSNDVFMYYNSSTEAPILTISPPISKTLMILAPFTGAPLVEVQGKVGSRATIVADTLCGWYYLPIVGDPNIQVRLLNGTGTATYGAQGTGTLTYMDLTGMFDTKDTVWLNPLAAGPEWLTSFGGLKGKCATIRLASIIRDFASNKTHPDFETVGWTGQGSGCAGLLPGVVAPTLGADKKPTQIKAACGITKFDEWFGRSAGPYFTGCLDLDLTMNSAGVYEKKADEFFPIDHIGVAQGDAYNGMGIDMDPSPAVHAHNYGFCMETHARFTYKGNEEFSFRGDDDVWVFINNKLVVDLGGVHEQLDGSVKLSTLGLTPGEIYPFDFFFCERQSTGSHMWITTDIDLIEARDVVLDRETITNSGVIQYRYAVFVNTQGGVGCVTENRTDKLSAIYQMKKENSATSTNLAAGSHYGGGILINATRDTVVVDTTHMYGLDSGATYILYVIDPTAHSIYDSIIFHIPPSGTVPPPPNLAPTAKADTFSIAEDKVNGAVVGQVVASDPENSPLTYKLSGSGPFAIDATGKISLTGPIDFERTKDYPLTVIVSDGLLADTVSILVKVTNVSEPIEVRIESVLVGDSLWGDDPDTVYTNVLKADLNGVITGSEITGSIDTLAKVTLKEGINRVGIRICTADKLICSADSVVILVNTKRPTVEFEHPKPDTSGIKNLVYEYVESDTFFVNSPWAKIPGTLVLKNKKLELDTIEFNLNLIDYKLKEGVNQVVYSFTDDFGNKVTMNLVVVLDTTPPEVVIQNPIEKQIFRVYNIDVDWTVEGETMDTLTRASISSGANRIVRSAMDRAGNIGSDTVNVILKLSGADVAIDLVKPVVMLKPEDVEEAFAVNPPRKDERFTLSVVNQLTDQEDEVAYGTSDGKNVRPKKVGEGRTYSTQGKNAHVGPTLRIEVKLQSVGGINGAGSQRGGTLRELMEWAASNEVEPEDALCGEDIPESMWDSLPLWRNQVKVETQFYDNLGQFVDQYTVSADSVGPQYLDDGGMATFNLSLSPDKSSKSLKDSRGRTMATGAYLVRGVVNATSTYLWCAGQYKQGDKIKSTENILKGFGYRRYDSKGK